MDDEAVARIEDKPAHRLRCAGEFALGAVGFEVRGHQQPAFAKGKSRAPSRPPLACRPSPPLGGRSDVAPAFANRQR
ncbi:hypothetical protein EN741_33820 [Mesorhizobium sp. M4B.F.Ca.ET.019.03.1.1]|nr:hypothetical protein EN741_33820 [Mesorhizobium sp. M4B.F.Ca.ET.019.03.1.1]